MTSELPLPPSAASGHWASQCAVDATDALEDFGAQNFIKKLLDELEKDHIGDRRQKVFMFCTLASSLLQPSMRMSVAVLGDSAAGKDNAVTTCMKHMPDGKAADFNRMTGSVMEDDIAQYNAIYIGEGNFQRDDGANKAIIEQIKQLAEGGMHVLKKDVKTGFKETKDIRQERKTVIFSTTESGHDEELSTRFCIMTIKGSQPKTKAVNDNTLEMASSLSKSIEEIERKENPSWLKVGLTALKVPDLVVIPYAKEIPVDCRSDRSKRDLKRFLNLIRALAFMQQKNRPWSTINGRFVIFAVPEDYLQALEIGADIFAQSYSGLDTRMLQTLEAMKQLIAAGEGEDENGKVWVDRAKIQRHLGIKTRLTIARRMQALENIGIIEKKPVSGRPSYAQSVHSGVQYPFIPFNKKDFDEQIAKKYYQKMNGIERSVNGQVNAFSYMKPIVCDLSDPEAFTAFTPLESPDQKDAEPQGKPENERLKMNALDEKPKDAVELLEIWPQNPELSHKAMLKIGWTPEQIEYAMNLGLIMESKPGFYSKV